MRQIDVVLEWDEVSGDPTFFAGEDDPDTKWKFEDVLMADWKDQDAQADSIVKIAQHHPEEEVVVLFDGSDTMIYASMGDVIKS